MKHSHRQISWSDLPPELVEAVAKRLETRVDILHFRRVCKTWRALAPLSLLIAKNTLSPLFPYHLDEVENSYTKVVIANSVFLVRSAVNPNLPPWLFTTEEMDPGFLAVRLPLFRSVTQDLPDDFPYDLDLSTFDVLELGTFHSISGQKITKDIASGKDLMHRNTYLHDQSKVVLFVNPNSETCLVKIDDCSIVELFDSVGVSVRRLKNGEKQKVSFKKRKFDDIVSFNGKIYGVDRKGRVCAMDYDSLKMCSVVEDPLCEGSGSDNKKRLAVSCGELYLIYRWCKKGSAAFKVFKLNEEEEKWDKLEGIGNDRILFVTFDGCFFASTKDFPKWRGNCIVFPCGSFPQYSGSRTLDVKIFIPVSLDDDELDIAVFHFEGGDCGPVERYPGYSEVFWPPPSWLSTGALSASDFEKKDGAEGKVQVEGQGGGRGEDDDDNDNEEEEEELQSYCSCQIASQLSDEEMSPNYVEVSKGIEPLQQDIDREEFKDQNNVDSAQALNSSPKIADKDVSKVKFLGVDVESHLIPILHKIWDEHGNIIEGHVVNSDSLLTWALESLAKITLILQGDVGRSLDDSKAKYINSILLDLQSMHFRLDWLAPYVENASTLQKNKVDMELETEKSKLQQELCVVKDGLAEEEKLAPKSHFFQFL